MVLSESSSSDNLVFMTNQGGSTGCSGEWTICGGNSQSYADETVRVGVRFFFFTTTACCTPSPFPRVGRSRTNGEATMVLYG